MVRLPGIKRPLLWAAAALATLTGVAATSGPAPAALADAEPPRGAVAGPTGPLHGPVDLLVSARDDGGLTRAVALIDGIVRGVAALGPTGCLPPGSSGGQGEAQAVTCPTGVERHPLRLDPTGIAPGIHLLEVRLADAAGNEALVFAAPLELAAPRQATPARVRLAVGQAPSAGNPPPGRPAADQRPCPSPRLSAMLAGASPRVRAGRPLLARGQAYRYRGRLTCRIGRTWQGAPRGTRIAIRVAGRARVVGPRSVRVRRGGRFVARFSHWRAGALVFRRGSSPAALVRIPFLLASDSARLR